jgi:hypothetical protein
VKRWSSARVKIITEWLVVLTLLVAFATGVVECLP